MSSYRALRPLLFHVPPEKAHRAAIRALQCGLAPKSSFTHPALATELAGLSLPSPVGLAAGFDKNAEAMEGALRAGFGFVEIGTVTPRAQAGNPQPRVFRLVQHEAIINRLGFNNEGVDAAARRLSANRHGGVVGGNVGKNKDSAEALPDYIAAMEALYGYVDYITANISSPNTPGLRNLQAKDELQALVRGLHAGRASLMERYALAYKPIFVKIAPDNDEAALAAIAEVALEQKLDGLIVSNTTIAREGVQGPHAQEAGGLSGRPLMEKSTQVLARMHALTGGAVPLIGVGGIANAADAYAKIRAGASAVQLYSALIYQGMGLVEQINRGLVDLLARDGFSRVADAVGRG
jgi:dihydroorotate dehydrogenase